MPPPLRLTRRHRGEHWTLDRHFYLSLLGDERLFQVPDAVSSASWSESIIEGTGGLRWKSVGRAAGVVLTPAALRSQTARVVNQVFDFFDGRSRLFDLSVDTTPVKAALKGDAGRRFARLLAEDLPVGGSAADFKLRPGRLPVSRPADVSIDRAAAIIQAGLPSFTSTIPDTVRFSGEPWFRAGTSPWTGGPRLHLFAACLAASLTLLLIMGGFWTAAAFVGGETRFERLQWFGWSLLAPAADMLLMGLLVSLAPWVPWGMELVNPARGTEESGRRSVRLVSLRRSAVEEAEELVACFQVRRRGET